MGGLIMRRTLVPLLSIRSFVLLGAMLLALALVVLASLAASKPADAATQTVIKVFDKPGTIFIPAGAHPGSDTTCDTGPTGPGAAGPYPSTRNVQAFPAGSRVLDVNLVLKGFRHTFPDDVDVLLSKGVRTRTVFSDVGDGFTHEVNSPITFNLDDEAANGHLPDEDQLFGGRFQPTNDGAFLDNFPEPVPDFSGRSALAGFDGASTNGSWQLRVFDDDSFDCGEFGGGWRLIIKAAVPTS
jgi:hypothetical protein